MLLELRLSHGSKKEVSRSRKFDLWAKTDPELQCTSQHAASPLSDSLRTPVACLFYYGESGKGQEKNPNGHIKKMETVDTMVPCWDLNWGL